MIDYFIAINLAVVGCYLLWFVFEVIKKRGG